MDYAETNSAFETDTLATRTGISYPLSSLSSVTLKQTTEEKTKKGEKRGEKKKKKRKKKRKEKKKEKKRRKEEEEKKEKKQRKTTTTPHRSRTPACTHKENWDIHVVSKTFKYRRLGLFARQKIAPHTLRIQLTAQVSQVEFHAA